MKFGILGGRSNIDQQQVGIAAQQAVCKFHRINVVPPLSDRFQQGRFAPGERQTGSAQEALRPSPEAATDRGGESPETMNRPPAMISSPRL